MPRLSAVPALAVLALVVGLLAACATPAHRGAPPERALASPGALESRSFQQILAVRVAGRERRLLAAGELCADSLVLVLLSPQGLELLRLRHDTEGLEVHRREALPRGITPRAILADLQLVHWPVSALRAAWGEDWTLKEAERQRTLLYRGRPVARVDYTGPAWQAPVTLAHEVLGYRLQVETIDHHLVSDCSKRTTNELE